MSLEHIEKQLFLNSLYLRQNISFLATLTICLKKNQGDFKLFTGLYCDSSANMITDLLHVPNRHPYYNAWFSRDLFHSEDFPFDAVMVKISSSARNSLCRKKPCDAKTKVDSSQ